MAQLANALDYQPLEPLNASGAGGGSAKQPRFAFGACVGEYLSSRDASLVRIRLATIATPRCMPHDDRLPHLNGR
jgi:hypothetical protein